MSGTGRRSAWHGPFHRKKSPTQTAAVALEQERSWVQMGRSAKWGWTPSVKAYRGPLPPGQEGVEFFTLSPPQGTHPQDVFWFIGSQDVWEIHDASDIFALIVAEVTTRTYI